MSIREIILLLINYSSLPWIIRLLIQKNKVTIIYYHNISPKVFDNHLIHIKKRYNIISLQSYLQDSPENSKKFRLIITFDDGLIENYTLLPILIKHNISATIFLTSGLINTNRHFWFLLDGLDRKEKNMLKKISDSERLNYLAENYGYFDEKEYSYKQALTYLQIKEMQPYFDFQSHSISHPCLNLCSDEKSKNEIEGSMKHLNNSFELNINSIAFPNGDYSDREVLICRESGYLCALSTKGGFNSNIKDTYVLKRIKTGDTQNINELILRITGIWGLLNYSLTKIKQYV